MPARAITRAMAVAESPRLEPESRIVVGWRFDELRRAGYDERKAMELALRGDVDLHVALELMRRGCPVDTAMRILR